MVAKPSLSDAYVKVRWARKQLRELEMLCASRGKAILKTKRLYYQRVLDKPPKNSRNLFTIQPGATKMPDRAKILTGQVVHGLRSALDYLIGDLSGLDSGIAKRRTQFPVESAAKLFAANASRNLAGLNAAHVAEIEELQPYNGCDWTQDLAALSNRDKHNSLVPMKLDFIYSGMLDPMNSAKSRPPRYKVRMHMKASVFVAIGREFELIETLRKIHAGVAQTLDRFKPEFR